MTDMTDRARELGVEFTEEQIEAITYAYMDICATDTHLNGSKSAYDGMAALEIGEAVKMTREDLERVFPFLIEDIGDE